MNKEKNTDPIIVIIATSFARTKLLLERSLKSIYEQSNINPHQVYVVDDNPIKDGKQYSEEYYKIDRVIKTLREEILRPKFDDFKKQRKTDNIKFESYFHTNLIKNTRTKGFSGTGAWNSGAFKALRYSKRNFFLAFLDDDDEWKTNYLETLFRSIDIEERISNSGQLKNTRTIAVVSGFSRIEDKRTIKIKANIDTFTKDNFFIGNPGLQGSNLFIELKTFWTIGGFDESLKSATDRDLAIRLIEYESIRTSKKIVFIDEYLVNHYATSKNRVTTILNNKKKGLDVFYRKYLHQFSKSLQEKSLHRAKKLFNYTISAKTKKPEINSNKQTKQAEIKEPFNLIIAAISDNAENLTKLFESFLNLYQKHGEYLKDYRFLILENTNDEYKIRPIINYFISNKNLKIEIIKNISNGRSIAENRTYLQNKVYEKGESVFSKNYISWIIDDDHLFKFDSENEILVPNYFEIIAKESHNKIDAMFGAISDAPPLPFSSTLRTQLIDFYYNLTYFANCNPEKKFELNVLQEINIKREEFYYDLSNSNFQHLEYPYYENFKNKTNVEAFKNSLEETALLSNGVNIFRKLTFNPDEIGKITNKESIYRGGNTIIFNPNLLKTPNYTPKKGYNRRSDFNWAIINRDIFKYKLYQITLPLKHDRKLQQTSWIANEKKLRADIEGLIFYRLFENIINQENWKNKTKHKNELKFYKHIKKKIFTKIKISNYRTLHLIHLILRILKNVKLWWFKNEYRADINYNIQQNIFIMEVLIVELGKRKSQVFLQNLENDMKVDNEFINMIVKKIKEF